MGRKTDINIVSKFKEKLKEKFSIKEIIFFGSRANGKPIRWSDFDLIIVSDDFEKVNIFERAGMMYDYWEIDYPVDFICLTSKEFNKLKKGITLVSEALKKGIVIN